MPCCQKRLLQYLILKCKCISLFRTANEKALTGHNISLALCSVCTLSVSHFIYIYIFKLINLFTFYFWLCWVFAVAHRLFSSCCEQGLLFVAVRGLLIAVASLVAEHRL